jgi:AcrR family transcriptional regulator
LVPPFRYGSRMNTRELARHAIREEILRSAWTLFPEQGFEATTIDQIAEAAGMSRRTFFRYFASKDELMLERLESAGVQIAEALAARPEGESPWRSLRVAFDAAVSAQDAAPDSARTLGRVLRDEPAARANMEERRRRWLALFTPILAERIGGPDARIRATALASAAVACLDAAQAAWIEDSRAQISELLDVAMSAVAPLG